MLQGAEVAAHLCLAWTYSGYVDYLLVDFHHLNWSVEVKGNGLWVHALCLLDATQGNFITKGSHALRIFCDWNFGRY